MKTFLRYTLLLLLLLSLKIKAQTAVSIKDIPYKQLKDTDVKLLSLDIYTSSNTQQKKPVVIYFHGGAWCMGDKSRNMKDKVALFQDLGYVFVSANYRLSPFPARPNDKDRVKFPVHNQDVASAIKWVYDSISKYGGDPLKIAIMGHSAGAHLVSLTGTNATFLEEAGLKLSNIAGVISLDTACYDVPEMLKWERGTRLYLNAFGDDPQENRSASPVWQVSQEKGAPSFFIVKRGSVARRKEAENFIQKLRENNIKVKVVDAGQYSHGGVNNAIGSAEDEVITPALIQFFKNCFYEK